MCVRAVVRAWLTDWLVGGWNALCTPLCHDRPIKSNPMTTQTTHSPSSTTRRPSRRAGRASGSSSACCGTTLATCSGRWGSCSSTSSSATAKARTTRPTDRPTHDTCPRSVCLGWRFASALCLSARRASPCLDRPDLPTTHSNQHQPHTKKHPTCQHTQPNTTPKKKKHGHSRDAVLGAAAAPAHVPPGPTPALPPRREPVGVRAGLSGGRGVQHDQVRACVRRERKDVEGKGRQAWALACFPPSIWMGPLDRPDCPAATDASPCFFSPSSSPAHTQNPRPAPPGPLSPSSSSAASWAISWPTPSTPSSSPPGPSRWPAGAWGGTLVGEWVMAAAHACQPTHPTSPSLTRQPTHSFNEGQMGHHLPPHHHHQHHHTTTSTTTSDAPGRAGGHAARPWDEGRGPPLPPQGPGRGARGAGEAGQGVPHLLRPRLALRPAVQGACVLPLSPWGVPRSVESLLVPPFLIDPSTPHPLPIPTAQNTKPKKYRSGSAPGSSAG